MCSWPRQRCRWSLPCTSREAWLKAVSQACVPGWPPGLEQQQLLLLASALARSLAPPTCTGSPGLFLGTVPSTVRLQLARLQHGAPCGTVPLGKPQRLPVSLSGDFMLRAVVNHCHFQTHLPLAGAVLPVSRASDPSTCRGGGSNFSPVPAALLARCQASEKDRIEAGSFPGTREAAPGQLSRTVLGWGDRRTGPVCPVGTVPGIRVGGTGFQPQV